MNNLDVVKLLVVDDEQAIVEEMTEYFESCGFVCIGATSAKQAKAIFSGDSEIGVIISDLRMPDEEGIALIKSLVNAYANKRVFEAILFTGHGGQQEVVDAMRVGIGDYYQKPVNMDELHRAVVRLIERVKERRVSAAAVNGLGEKLNTMEGSLNSLTEQLKDIRSKVGLPQCEPAKALPTTMNAALFDGLTSRQKDVALLVAQGLSNYQIGCELGISENTVKLYVSQILTATGRSNRTQLALAIQNNEG